MNLFETVNPSFRRWIPAIRKIADSQDVDLKDEDVREIILKAEKSVGQRALATDIAVAQSIKDAYKDWMAR